MDVLLPFLAVVLPVVGYTLLGRSYRKDIRTADELFTAGRRVGFVGYFGAVTSSGISLGAAIVAFLYLGYDQPSLVVVAIGTWIVGYGFHYWAVRRALNDFPEFKAHHYSLCTYLGAAYNSVRVRKAAAWSSAIALGGALGVEMSAITKIAAPYVSASVQSIYVEIPVLMLLIIGLATYVSAGGILAATRTATVQFWTFVVTILLITNFLLEKTDKSVFGELAQLAQLPEVSYLLFGLIFLNLFFNTVDIGQWQRSLSCNSLSDVKKGLIGSTFGIATAWGLLGILGVALRGASSSGDPVRDFVAVFAGQPLAFSLFLIAAGAALLSTASFLALAAVETYMRDVRAVGAGQTNSGLGNGTQLTKCRRAIWIAVMLHNILFAT